MTPGDACLGLLMACGGRVWIMLLTVFVLFTTIGLFTDPGTDSGNEVDNESSFGAAGLALSDAADDASGVDPVALESEAESAEAGEEEVLSPKVEALDALLDPALSLEAADD